MTKVLNEVDEPWGAERKRALVLEILKGHLSPHDAARRHGLSLAQVTEWQTRFLSGALSALDDAPTPGSRALDRRRVAFVSAAVGIVLIWIGLRTAFWNGYYTEDAPGYVTDAIWLALGEFQARSYVNGLNVGTYAPVAIPIRLFGKSELALSLWPLFCSLLGVVSIGGASALLFGRGLGLVAALLYATYPGDVFFSTVVMPDAIQAGWLSFSMFLVVLANAGKGERRGWLLGAAGVAMGCCHLIRANDVLLVPIGLAAALLFSRIWKREPAAAAARAGLTYLSGWLLVIVAEGLVYFWTVGDFLHRVHVIMRHYGTPDSVAQWGLNTRADTIPFSIFPPLLWMKFRTWGQLNQDQAYHALTFVVALGALAAGAAALIRHTSRRDVRVTAGYASAAVWCLWPLLYHQFGSQSLTEYVPMHRLSRHLVVYAPGAIFAAVAGLGVVRTVASRWRFAPARIAVTATAWLVLLVQVDFSVRGERIAYAAYHEIKSTYVRIRERLPRGVQTIIADPGDLCFFDFWLNPLGSERVKLAPFAEYEACSQLESGVVLTGSNPGWHGAGAPAIQQTVRRLPCLLQPPGNWRLIYQGHPERLFIIEDDRGSRP